jgi:hypothetical protein
MAVAYSAVEAFCACKYVNHCLVSIIDISEGGVNWCIKEGVFNS